MSWSISGVLVTAFLNARPNSTGDEKVLLGTLAIPHEDKSTKWSGNNCRSESLSSENGELCSSLLHCVRVTVSAGRWTQPISFYAGPDQQQHATGGLQRISVINAYCMCNYSFTDHQDVPHQRENEHNDVIVANLWCVFAEGVAGGY